MNSMKVRFGASWIITALALAGCSGPPSNAEVEAIVLDSMAQWMAFIKQEGQPDVPPDEVIHAVSRDGCERTGESSYECLVTTTYNPQYAVMGEQHTQRMRFTKTSNGWYAEEVQ
ncbi:MAG: hypothetical protein KAG72_15205 [Abyssibacter sp.]|nr:hypothetical protein [Abyssibacter sp.]MCK5860697.1 hypothetical protein [Abyssibacter sp.]